jgi:hypothetical protein
VAAKQLLRIGGFTTVRFAASTCALLSILQTLYFAPWLPIFLAQPWLQHSGLTLCGAALVGLRSIATMLTLPCVFDVIALSLFDQVSPDRLGCFGHPLCLLFQEMTRGSWSVDIARPAMEIPLFAAVFLISFILFGTFTRPSLCTAITVHAMQTFTKNEHRATRTLIETVGSAMKHGLHAEALSARQKIRETRDLLLSALHNPASLTSPSPKESPSP